MPAAPKGPKSGVVPSRPSTLDSRPFSTPAAFARWLRANHTKAPDIWIRFARKDTGIASITHDQALDIALAHGWIDAQVRRIDDRWWTQRFTPRGPRSRWSEINCAKAVALINQGLMRPAGLARIEEAKADGRWAQAYAPQRTIAVPPDLQARLKASPRARAFFAGLDSKNRYAILYRLHQARKPETRIRRLDKFVAMLEAGETLH
ncbi:MAG: YdeI/OmpD-associated family protein [Gemmatimonadota bacterium]